MMAHPWEIVPARNGAPTLKVAGCFVHSGYDPVGEANQWAENVLKGRPSDQPMLVLGVGLGYHIEALLSRGANLVGAVEVDPNLIKEVRDKNPRIPWHQFHLFTGPNPVTVGREIAQKFPTLPAVIPYDPIVRTYSHYFQSLLKTLKEEYEKNIGRCGDLLPPPSPRDQTTLRLPLKKESLRVIVVAPIHGGSLPIARYTASAFQRLGYYVALVDPSPFALVKKAIETNRALQKLKAKLVTELIDFSLRWIDALSSEGKFDLVFFLAQAPVSLPLLRNLRRRHQVTAFWFVEDYRLFPYWKEWANQYDHFFIIQQEPFLSLLKGLGVKSAHYLPLAADPSVHRVVSLTDADRERFGSPISHVGVGYRNRRRIFTALADHPFKIWGDGWERAGGVEHLLQENSRRLSEEESVKVFNATLINLNLHSSAYHDGINPDGDFLNPRTFEICACGGFQLVDQRTLLPLHFAPGRELVVYRTLEEMLTAIDYYLHHPQEREEIAHAGRLRVLQEHTYDHRITYALSLMGMEADPHHYLSGRNTSTPPTLPTYPSTLNSESEERPLRGDNGGEDGAWEEFLKGHSRNGQFDLLSFAQKVLNSPPRPLTRAEMIALLMNELYRWGEEKGLV